METEMERYSVITEKNRREIVLLRGSGCFWRKCRFCDYHLDYSKNQQENDKLNFSVLANVTGVYGRLEVINSGSFPELSQETMDYIENVCRVKNITHLHFESHWNYRHQIPQLRNRFKNIGVAGVKIHMKIGVETFDSDFREKQLVKGIDTSDPSEIAKYFDECCLLQGIQGQTVDSMCHDIETGLAHFDRVCINVMVENGKEIKPDRLVIDEFITNVLPIYKENPRVDILMDNTDFGVGGMKND